MDIKKIVLTGGPCAGKTTALGRIKTEFEALGYTVLTVAETATEMITGGVAPWTCGESADFQKLRLELQLEKESVFFRAARTMEREKVLIVCDRGALDSVSYMSGETFREALAQLGKSETELRDSYDAVFHLVTSAKGSMDHFRTGEGTGRNEDAQRAAELDDKLISAWCGNPHMRVIGCRDSFEEKMDRLIMEIASFLGVPEPIETERKYLIKYPDLGYLSSYPFCRKTEIEQTYLVFRGERIRRRGAEGSYICFHTAKRAIDGIRRYENERRIGKAEYDELMKFADPGRGTLKKDRYCLVYNEQYFEIDVYPFWNDKAIMEIELCDPGEKVDIPPFIEVMDEVTGDPAYSNASLARNLK